MSAKGNNPTKLLTVINKFGNQTDKDKSFFILSTNAEKLPAPKITIHINNKKGMLKNGNPLGDSIKENQSVINMVKIDATTNNIKYAKENS